MKPIIVCERNSFAEISPYKVSTIVLSYLADQPMEIVAQKFKLSAQKLHSDVIL